MGKSDTSSDIESVNYHLKRYVILQNEDVATRLFSCEELCSIVNDGCGDLVVVAQLWCRSLLMWPYFMMVSGCCGVVKRWSDGGRGAQPPCRHARLPPLSSTSRGPCQGFSYITIKKTVQYKTKNTIQAFGLCAHNALQFKL